MVGEQQSPALYQGFYINLRESAERDRSMQTHLQSLGLSSQYERFEAIRGQDFPWHRSSPLNAGSIGCGLSHKRLLDTHRSADLHLHVLEDDAEILPELPTWFTSLAKHHSWDLIYSDVYFSMLSPQVFQQLSRLIKAYRQQGSVSLVNLRGAPFVGATSYFVNRHSIGKVADLLGTNWINRCKHDEHLNSLVQTGHLQAFVTVPFLSTRSRLFKRSTIDSEYTSLMQAMDLQRAAFFANANLETLVDKAEQLRLGTSKNPLLTVYLETTRSILEHIDQGIHQKPGQGGPKT
jgi:hypothetical protein